MPLLITLVVVGLVAVSYLAYYRNQVAYHTGRNLRLLSMLTAQIDGRVEMFAGFVRTFSDKNPPKDVTRTPCGLQPSNTCLIAPSFPEASRP